MNFKAKTEDELQQENLAPKGQYTFEVISAKDTISKKGNEMIALEIGLYQDGNDRARWFVYDYLLEAMAFKLKHFCETTGQTDKYEKGTLTAIDCTGKMGTVEIDIESANGQYKAKNFVVDYVKPGETTQSTKEELAF